MIPTLYSRACARMSVRVINANLVTTAQWVLNCPCHVHLVGTVRWLGSPALMAFAWLDFIATEQQFFPTPLIRCMAVSVLPGIIARPDQFLRNPVHRGHFLPQHRTRSFQTAGHVLLVTIVLGLAIRKSPASVVLVITARVTTPRVDQQDSPVAKAMPAPWEAPDRPYVSQAPTSQCLSRVLVLHALLVWHVNLDHTIPCPTSQKQSQHHCPVQLGTIAQLGHSIDSSTHVQLARTTM